MCACWLRFPHHNRARVARLGPPSTINIAAIAFLDAAPCAHLTLDSLEDSARRATKKMILGGWYPDAQGFAASGLYLHGFVKDKLYDNYVVARIF